jgi:hypothetical protein
MALKDALTSHGAYWSDPSFGAFMLAGKSLRVAQHIGKSRKAKYGAGVDLRSCCDNDTCVFVEIFSTKMDLLRTGIGLARSGEIGIVGDDV